MKINRRAITTLFIIIFLTNPLIFTHFGQAEVLETLYDDDEGFWGVDSGGVGGIGISVSEETGTVYSGSSSLRYSVVSGSKAWVNIQHSYSGAQDWSGYDDLAFYWYGQGSGASFTVNAEASTSSDRFSGSFTDDFVGWRRVVLPLGGFTRYGAASWSNVKKILIVYGGADINSWILDRAVLKGNAPSDEENLKILRYAAFTTIQSQYRKDSDYISNYCDLYMCWYWDEVVAQNMDPSVLVLEYKNWHSIADNSADFQIALDNGWVLRDLNGEYVYEKGWPQNKVMDPGSYSFKQYLVDWVGASITRGFEGVWADNSNSIYPQTAWRLSALPVNPRTGEIYTNEDWLNDHVELINYVKSVYPEYYFCSNGMLYNGREFFKDLAFYTEFLSKADFENLFIEGIFNDAKGVPYPEADWKKSVELVIWLQNNFLNDPSKSVILRSQASGSIPSTPDEFSEFIVASCLLGVSKENQNYVSAMFNMESDYTQALFNVQLGIPTESYHIVDGTHVYEREYTKVKILVNPTANTYEVNLDEPYTTVGGETISTTIMQPYSGNILIRP